MSGKGKWMLIQGVPTATGTAFLQPCNETELLYYMFLPSSVCQRARTEPSPTSARCTASGDLLVVLVHLPEINLRMGNVMSLWNPPSWEGAKLLLDLARRVSQELLTRVIKTDIFKLEIEQTFGTAKVIIHGNRAPEKNVLHLWLPAVQA